MNHKKKNKFLATILYILIRHPTEKHKTNLHSGSYRDHMTENILFLFHHTLARWKRFRILMNSVVSISNLKTYCSKKFNFKSNQKDLCVCNHFKTNVSN